MLNIKTNSNTPAVTLLRHDTHFNSLFYKVLEEIYQYLEKQNTLHTKVNSGGIQQTVKILLDKT